MTERLETEPRKQTPLAYVVVSQNQVIDNIIRSRPLAVTQLWLKPSTPRLLTSLLDMLSIALDGCFVNQD